MSGTVIDLGAIKRFLLRANKPHATLTATIHRETDASRTIVYAENDWSMHDNFFGGDPYGGRQVIFYKSIPVWLTAYYGHIHDTDRPPSEIHGFLREALQRSTDAEPYRGPRAYKKGDLAYHCTVDGGIDEYSCKEVILENGKQVYWAHFIGGLVNQRAQQSM